MKTKRDTPSVVRVYLIAGTTLGIIGPAVWFIVSGANPFLGIFFLIFGGILLFAFVRMNGSTSGPDWAGHLPSTPWRRRLLLIALAAVVVTATFLRRGPITSEAVIAIGIGIALVELVLFWQRRQSRSSTDDR